MEHTELNLATSPTDKCIVLIDDDHKLLDLISRYLRSQGWTVWSSTSPKAGIALLKEYRPQLAILDMMMPEMSGIDLCKQIREESAVPIIFLTAKETVADRIAGLNNGADDYIPKPVDPGELLARIEAVLRRTTVPAPAAAEVTEVLSFKEIKLNLRTQEVSLRGERVGLTTNEFQALKLLAQNHGRILSRQEIVENLRGHDWNVFDRSIDILMSRLRQKLGENPKEPKYLKTIWGEGYLFIAEI